MDMRLTEKRLAQLVEGIALTFAVRRRRLVAGATGGEGKRGEDGYRHKAKHWPVEYHSAFSGSTPPCPGNRSADRFEWVSRLASRVIVAAAVMNGTKPLEPSQALRLLLQALGGRISIPLSLIRGRIAQMSKKVALEIEPASPGLRIRGEAHALGAPIRFAARIDADGVHVEGERRTIRIRLSEVDVSTSEDAPGPLADAIRGRMIDTNNPATLIGNMISLPDVIVEAKGQDIILDLMRAPAIQRDEMLRATVAAATSYLCVKGIRVRDDAIELQLGLLPAGPKEAVLSTTRAALTPAVRLLWPEGRNR